METVNLPGCLSSPRIVRLVLSLVLAESALELVPNELNSHPAILSCAHRKRKDPGQLILDQTYHYAAILRLGRQGVGRGRPDLVHLSLLLALGSPLSLEGHLRCYVHTRDNHVITVSPRARLPRNTDRFVGLAEQLYKEKVVPPIGSPLLSLAKATLPEFLDGLEGDIVVALTTQGTARLMADLARSMVRYKRPVLLVGGFPEGHFSKTTLQRADVSYSVDRRRLEAWTVVARAVYDFETALNTTVAETTLM